MSEINSFGGKKKRATINDIAKEAGVSVSMVSRVASGKGVVSEKNREKIQKLLKYYNYKPNAFARGLQKSKSGLIGFVIPHIGNEYFSSVYYEFEKHASEKGYMTTLYNGKSSPEVESNILKALEEARVEAAIIMGGRLDLVNLEPKYVKELKEFASRVPSVLCTERAGEFGCLGVHSDDAMACSMLVRYLKDKKYRTIGMLGGTVESYPSVFKRKYMLEEIKKAGLIIKPEWIIGDSFNERDGAQSMQRLLELSERPEVVFCINDHVAFGAMIEARDAGIKIPEDMSIIGSDGVNVSTLSRPEITTLKIDFETYGNKVFEAMEALINGQTYNELTLIRPELVIRGSSR